jgi:hypothetical protein
MPVLDSKYWKSEVWCLMLIAKCQKPEARKPARLGGLEARSWTPTTTQW